MPDAPLVRAVAVRRSLIFCSAALLVSFAAGAVLYAAGGDVQPGHRPFHIGCTNHNHGPKWYAGHGAALNRMRSLSEQPSGDIRSRAITALR
jgi:hypothetical protein